MSFDITFHPFGADEVERFVFDVWRDPSLAAERAKELSGDENKQRAIIELIYGRFEAWREALVAGTLELSKTLSFACAALSGYRHFYFYARGSALSFLADHLAEIAELFIPLTKLPGAPAELAALEGDSPLLRDNYSASGFLPPSRFAELRRALARIDEARSSAPTALFSLFDAADRASLEQVLEAAESHGRGLIEAADLVVPRAREGSTDLDKLRLIRRVEDGPSDRRQLFPCLSKGRGER